PRGRVLGQLRWLVVSPRLVGAPEDQHLVRGFCPRQPAGSRQSIEQVILVGRQVEREASSLTRLGNKGAAARAGAESAGSTERGPTSVLAQDQYVILSRLEQSHDDPRRFVLQELLRVFQSRQGSEIGLGDSGLSVVEREPGNVQWLDERERNRAILTDRDWVTDPRRQVALFLRADRGLTTALAKDALDEHAEDVTGSKFVGPCWRRSQCGEGDLLNVRP